VQYRVVRPQCFERIGIETAIQALGLLIGVLIGRKVSRAIARTIIPPKPRQALAFLWSVDGKKLPLEVTNLPHPERR
jgi:hypothetical protein